MRRRFVLGAMLLPVFLVFIAWLSYPLVGEWVVRDKALPRLAQKLGRKVEVGDVDLGRGTLVLHDLVVFGAGENEKATAEISRIDIRFDYRASLVGDIVVKEATVNGLRLSVFRDKDGKLSIDDILERLKSSNKDDSSRESQGGNLRPDLFHLRNGSVSLVEKENGVRVDASGMDATFTKGSEEVSLFAKRVQLVSGTGLIARFEEVVGTTLVSRPLDAFHATIGSGFAGVRDGELVLGDSTYAIPETLSLTGIKGNVQQGDGHGTLSLDLAGSYGGSSEALWEADGWLDLRSKEGKISLVAKEFHLDRLESVLQGSMVTDFADTSVDTRVELSWKDKVADVTGRLKVSNLTIFHPKVAVEPLQEISFDSEISSRFDLAARTLSVSSWHVVTKGVRYDLSGMLALPGGVETTGEVRKAPRMRLQFVMPPVPCQAALDSIPAALVPKLQGFSLDGTMSTDLVLAIDWADLHEGTELSGYVGLPDCTVKSPNEEFDAERLRHGFDHQIMVGPEEFETVDIGLASDNYVQIFDISRHFLNGVLTQEDSRFYDHNGFIPREFRSALIRNLEAKRFKSGASSITMQMVKNVFLYRDKTLSRKLQELFLTWYVEQVLDKDRILEIYVNAIEYGPAVYGIKKAAELYLDKHPRDLEPTEAAFLVDLLPHPRHRYFQYCQGKLTRRGKHKTGNILRNMLNRDRLSQEEYDEALESPLEFNPKKDKTICRRRPDW